MLRACLLGLRAQRLVVPAPIDVVHLSRHVVEQIVGHVQADGTDRDHEHLQPHWPVESSEPGEWSDGRHDSEQQDWQPQDQVCTDEVAHPSGFLDCLGDTVFHVSS